MNGPQNTLVHGLAKSGTTALFSRIRNSMPADVVVESFEPPNIETIKKAHEEARRKQAPLLVKVLHASVLEDLGANEENRRIFDKIVLIVRDPRDILVSATLYGGSYHGLWRRSPHAVARALALLRQRERGVPVPLGRLHEALTREPLDSRIASLVEGINACREAIKGFDNSRVFTIPYENFVTNDLDDLAGFFGYPLTGSGDVDPKFSRVTRTKSSGDWRRWITPDDVPILQNALKDILPTLGYDPDDWALEENAEIEPAHASEYVFRLLNEARVRENLPQIDAATLPDINEEVIGYRDGVKHLKSAAKGEPLPPNLARDVLGRLNDDQDAIGELEKSVVQLSQEVERLNRKIEKQQEEAKALHRINRKFASGTRKLLDLGRWRLAGQVLFRDTSKRAPDLAQALDRLEESQNGTDS